MPNEKKIIVKNELEISLRKIILLKKPNFSIKFAFSY